MSETIGKSPDAKPHVGFSGVSKIYDGNVRAVDGLNLEISQGEFLTLLGPSGSGKTTTLMMLAGFEAPSSGQITLAGRDITSIPAHKRGIGMVFQNYALFPHMTVAENLAFPLSVRGMGRAERDRLVARVLARVRLDDLQLRKPAQLSGGQQQRVALARALVFEPDLVLMDEPLGALDKQLRESLQYEIKEMHTSFGVTVIYVTHDQGEALTMSDRIALFRAGKIEQLGDPRMIYNSPASIFAARFIGETNILPGTVLGSEARGMVRVDLGNGIVVSARQGDTSGQSGEPISFCLRPQHLKFASDRTATTNCFVGKAIDVIFHGDHLRMQLVLPGEARLVARLPADGTTGITPGSEVALTFDPKNAIALDAAPADS